jgi:hypothetical protein
MRHRSAGAHGIEKFDGREPLGDIDTARALDGLQRLIEQDCARQDRKLGEVAGEGRVISRDLERAVQGVGRRRAHGVSFVCK